jgi:CDP-4-dehydro-6-deoxyglucose reductase
MREDLLYTVTTRHRRTPTILEIRLCPRGQSIDYQAGQYVLLGDADRNRPPRAYSIANAQRPDATIDLFVTLVPRGEVSPWAHLLHAGENVLVSGGYGTFVDDHEDDRPRLYLAGGSGLAPVRALAEAALRRAQPPPVTLLFSARTADHLIDDDLFLRWQHDNPTFTYLRTFTRAVGPPPVGHIPAVLPDLLPALDHHRVYISGGAGFVADCERAVRRQGAHPGCIFTEEFCADPVPGIGDQLHQGTR